MDIRLQPACLKWARERAGLSISELARKMHLKEDRIVAWEQSGEISLHRAERLAHITHTPFGYLLLPVPIADEMPIRDFRTIDMQSIARASVDLLDTIYDAQQKQDWYREYIISSGGTPLSFVGSIKVSNNVLAAADSIRNTTAWGIKLTQQSASSEGALTQFIDSVRQIGILVMRSGIVGTNTYRSLNVTEFRGFSLADRYAPLIFINGNDAKVAQMFTLAHELVHIWLGESGVSNLSFTYSLDLDTERFCNNVAAELLVPEKDLMAFLKEAESPIEQVTMLARHFKVSKLVILRRLRDTKYLSERTFNSLYADELAQYNQRSPKGKDSGGDFCNATQKLDRKINNLR